MSVLPNPRTPAGRAALAAVIADPGRALVALDYDGTVAPIVDRPEDAVAHPRAAAALQAVARAGARVAIVTGRPAGEAVRLGGLADVPGLVVLGHYGLDRWNDGHVVAPQPHPGIAAARRAVAGMVAEGPAGLALEDKGHSVALHSRRAADPAGALAAFRSSMEQLARETGLVVTPGRYVLELRPPDIDKGAALRELIAEQQSASVVFIGDDVGDLPAMRAVREMDVAGLVVCSDSVESPPELRQQADLVVPGPPGVVSFLESLAQLIVS